MANPVYQGVMSSFTPEGELVKREVRYESPSKSWICIKQGEDASLLCRANGFRMCLSKYGDIVLEHPELRVVSFTFAVIEKEVPLG